jgi:hypothetical protein
VDDPGDVRREDLRFYVLARCLDCERECVDLAETRVGGKRFESRDGPGKGVREAGGGNGARLTQWAGTWWRGGGICAGSRETGRTYAR